MKPSGLFRAVAVGPATTVDRGTARLADSHAETTELVCESGPERDQRQQRLEALLDRME